MRRWSRHSLRGARGFAIVALVLLTAGGAHAQSDTAAAQALFDEAKALMAKGKNAEACPKLEESQRLDPGLGTLFNLAECHEKTGRIATAWSRYVEVAAGARSAGRPDAERVAQSRASALGSRLPKLVLEVPAESSPGLEVLRDDVRVGAAQYGVAIPVDPGSHRISARAPGRKAWEAIVTAVEGQQSTVRVPVLEPGDGRTGAAPGSTQSDQPAPLAATDEGSSSQRTLGLVIGGVGIAGIGAGLVFGALANAQYDDASCPNNVCSSSAGEERDGAWTKATVATIAVGVGAAALAGGAILFFTAPKREKQTAFRLTSLKLGVVPGGVFVRGSL
jgi:hypothetical protein